MQLFWDRDDKLCVVDLDGKYPMLQIPAELEKGNKDRLLPMAPEFVEFLRETPAEKRRREVFRPLTRNRKTRPTEWWVSRVICEIGKAAVGRVSAESRTGKVKFASAHDLRRSFGERWSSKVMPHVLMMLMRHESIDTTMKFYVGRNVRAAAQVLWDAHNPATAGEGNRSGNTSEKEAASG